MSFVYFNRLLISRLEDSKAEVNGCVLRSPLLLTYVTILASLLNIISV